MTLGRPSALIGGLTVRRILAYMVSKSWGKGVLICTAVLGLFGPFVAIQNYGAESAAVALAGRSDSGGSILIPARCDVPGAELGKDFVIADGRVVQGRSRRSACFYSVSAFKRLFPERFKNDDPATFRVQQLTTGMRLLSPSTANAITGFLFSIFGPFLLIAFGMFKSALELYRGGWNPGNDT